jgi:lipoprotein NlpD
MPGFFDGQQIQVASRRHSQQGQWAARLGAMFCAALLTACGSTSLNRAPVEDRGANRPPASMGAEAKTDATGAYVKPMPGAENAGNPGYYTVKPGDTLIRIGLDSGQNWRDIVRWNALENPNQIEVGQVLLVQPPATLAAPTTGAAASRPVAAATATAGAVPPVGAASQPVAAGAATAKPASPAASGAVASTPALTADDDIAWIWPTAGTVLAGFDEVKNKGLDIGGAPGTSVVAAADGRVVYVGAGLRGYGNLIILKHNNTYLTAYAHNQTLLVKEDQSVRKGQKIAEMGSSDTDRVKLHFEVRRQGKPVDPAKYLPPR